MQDHPERAETTAKGDLEEPSPAWFQPPAAPATVETPKAGQPQDAQKKSDLPTLVLAQVGLTAFDGVIVLVYAALWVFNSDLLIQILQGMGGISLLLSLAPVILGAVILQKNKRRDKPMPGSIWADIGIWTGVVMSLMTLAIPVIATFRAIFSNPAGVP